MREASILEHYQPYNQSELDALWEKNRPALQHKIVVLDDDPTGVQTVHGVSVYTDWTEETITSGFQEENQIFFILTNSRAFTEKETTKAHQDIANRVEAISKKLGVPYLIISRGDSTLRGHYPLETEVMKNTIEQRGGIIQDGEVILPFFKEGGRYTIDDTHYVQDGDSLIPAGDTEFAKDRSFGYRASHLGEWVEEKTDGRFKKSDVTSITLEELRSLSIGSIKEKLMAVHDFGKVIVNAIDENDVKIFVLALIEAINSGKQFMFRTAAAFTKVIGNISSRPLLEREELILEDSEHGGLIIVGSHVKKTTDQLNALKELSSLEFIEFDCHLVGNQSAFAGETDRVLHLVENTLSAGVTTVVYTKRERLDLGEGMEEQELIQSVRISEALTSIVRDCAVRPNYIIAKGGITSSDVGTKGLQVKRATVAGQIAPGIPVWKTGQESTFPHIPYVIFPGNVGGIGTLKDVVLKLEN